jgi:hypothetical protein
VVLLTAAIGGPRVTICLCALIATCAVTVITLNWRKQHKRIQGKRRKNGD